MTYKILDLYYQSPLFCCHCCTDIAPWNLLSENLLSDWRWRISLNAEGGDGVQLYGAHAASQPTRNGLVWSAPDVADCSGRSNVGLGYGGGGDISVHVDGVTTRTRYGCWETRPTGLPGARRGSWADHRRPARRWGIVPLNPPSFPVAL